MEIEILVKFQDFCKFLERYQKGQKDKQYFQNAHQTK